MKVKHWWEMAFVLKVLLTRGSDDTSRKTSQNTDTPILKSKETNNPFHKGGDF